VATETRLVTAGVVGRTHSLDGSFYVERPDHSFELGTIVFVDGHERRVDRRAGTDDKPLVRLVGIGTREAARALRGQLVLVEASLAEGEWLAEDLVGCRVEGLGAVVQVIDAPSCDLLELEGGELVPLIADAVHSVDLDARTIAIDRRFLRLDARETE
jgi:16S rRNA processing protein RimM